MLKRTIFSVYRYYNLSRLNYSNVKPLFCNINTQKGVFWQATVNMSSASNIVNYEDVLAATKNSSVYIIDVREPKELQESGEIPNSINIPLGEVENVLKGSSTEVFSQKFGRPKPAEDAPIIFSCRSGKRAGMALNTALKLGYVNSKSYSGSWLDWEEKNKN